MYNIKKNVKLNDFSNETRDFLMDIGFTSNDDLGKMFEDFLKDKKIDLNEKHIEEYIYEDDLKFTETYTCTEIKVYKYQKDSHFKLFDKIKNNIVWKNAGCRRVGSC